VGIIAAGMFTLTIEGVQGSVVQMLSHGLTAIGMFYIVDIIEERTGRRDLPHLGGIRTLAPQFNTYYVIIMMAAVALPLTSGFAGEFLLFNGLAKSQYAGIIITSVAAVSIILGAVYMLRSYQSAMMGEQRADVSLFADVSMREQVVFVVLVFFILWIGMYPKTVIDVSAPTLEAFVTSVTGKIK
jgi:NADH-quinone oxidoreductase subunit M